MTTIGINGLGIIGRQFLRQLQTLIQRGEIKRGELEVKYFNDVKPAEDLEILLKHDTTYRAFPGQVSRKGNDFIIDGQRIKGSQEADPSKLGWDVDFYFDSTGIFTDKPKKIESEADQRKAQTIDAYLQDVRNRGKVLVFSAPSGLAEATLVYGVNHQGYKGEKIVSAGSCTTNCLAPLVNALEANYGKFFGIMTTVHAYTQDQALMDMPQGKDRARYFSAAENIVPTSTGAAKAIGKVLPVLDGMLDGTAVRVPVRVGSLVDLTANLPGYPSKGDIQKALSEAAKASREIADQTGYSEPTLSYESDPIVSSMIIGRGSPSIVDGSQIIVVGPLDKVFSWYDNVNGFSTQAVKLIRHMGESRRAA